MALGNLCTPEDVLTRMADMGLATASSESADTLEVLGRKIPLASEQIEMDLLTKVQKAIAPFEVDSQEHSPAQILATITDDSKTLLKQCGVTYTVRLALEEGEGRFRFKYETAADAIGKLLARWDRKCIEELEKVWPLLLFDLDGDGTITTIERGFSNRFSSIRLTA